MTIMVAVLQEYKAILNSAEWHQYFKKEDVIKAAAERIKPQRAEGVYFMKGEHEFAVKAAALKTCDNQISMHILVELQLAHAQKYSGVFCA